MFIEFFIALIPTTIRDIFSSVVADVVKGIFTYKNRRQQEKQAKETHDAVQRLEQTLANGFAEDPSRQIRNIADQLSPLIATLQVETCHQSLEGLRKEVRNDDQRSLSRIDYYLGCCSRYINVEQSKNEYKRAYDEMLEAKVYDNDIVAALIFTLCKDGDSNQALEVARQLKEHNNRNIWVWVPILVFANDLNSAYLNLPEDVNKNRILANAYFIGPTDKNIPSNIQTTQVSLPASITYENVPEWIFILTVLRNQYIQEWYTVALPNALKPGRCCIEFNGAVTKFYDLCSKTQLGELAKGLRLWYQISRCQITPQTESIDSIRDCDCPDELKIHRALAYANFLIKNNRQEEAKTYLDEQNLNNEVSIINIRLWLALQTIDPPYVEKTLQIAVENDVEFNVSQIIYLLSSARNFPESVKPYNSRLKFPEGLDYDAVRSIISHFIGETIDVNFLLQNRENFSQSIIPHTAIVLQEKGHTEEAISLCENRIPKDSLNPGIFIFIEILQKSPNHKDRLYKALGDLRRLGFTDDTKLLIQEFSLATAIHDSATMLSVSEILYKKNPKNNSFYIAYITSAVDNQRIDIIQELSETLKDYSFSERDAGQLFNVLIVSSLYNRALDFMYGYIKSHPTNEGLNMLFHNSSINPRISKIINEEYEAVFDGAYVKFVHNGQEQSGIVTASTRLKVLIGKSKGETVEDYDRLGRRDEYKVNAIHNKYRQLIEEIYKDVADGKYSNATPYCLTDDDMMGGNIIDVLNKLAGRDSNWYQQRTEFLDKYSRGEVSLVSFLRNDELIPSLYEHLFGFFKIYELPYREYENLQNKRHENVAGMTYVLDLSSLITIFELHQKYNLNYPAKFVISNGLYQFIKASLLKELHGIPSGVEQSIIKLLNNIPNTYEETWIVSRLRILLAWIENNTEIESATEILNVDRKGALSQSDYTDLFSESFVLAARGGRVLMSMDQNLLRTFSRYVPISDVNAYLHHFFPDIYPGIARFFIKASILGEDIDTKFILEEYGKYGLGQPSYFNLCRENLAVTCNYMQIMDVCIVLSERPVKTEGDNLIIDSLLQTLFKMYGGHQWAETALKTLLSMTNNDELRKRAFDVFKIVCPLYN